MSGAAFSVFCGTPQGERRRRVHCGSLARRGPIPCAAHISAMTTRAVRSVCHKFVVPRGQHERPSFDPSPSMTLPTTLGDKDELIQRIARDLIDSYDEELELEIEDRNPDEIESGQ